MKKKNIDSNFIDSYIDNNFIEVSEKMQFYILQIR